MHARILLLAGAALLLAAVPAQADRGGNGGSAIVTAAWSCDGNVTVEAENHAIGNIVIAHDGGPTKVETPFEGVELFEYVFAAGDYPGLTGVYVKAGRNGTRGTGTLVSLSEPVCVDDADGDGFASDVDCDDDDSTVYPGAPEIANDGIDQDCNGSDLVLGSGDIRVTLQWSAAPPETVDMDLYVVDPLGQKVWWGRTTVPSGGKLDRDDDACLDPPNGQSIENVHWPTGVAPAGTYTVGVDQWGLCAENTGGPASWTLQVYVDGVLVLDQSGTGDDDPAQGVAGPANTFTFPYP